MAGERRKPTAAEKGKAVMIEEEKMDKGMKAALNAVRATDAALLRPTGPVIREPSDTVAESPVVLRRSQRNRPAPAPTPGPRKKARFDAVVPGPTPPPPPPDLDLGMFSKALSSVVTVVFHTSVDASTSYRTGFILIDEKNYSVVLTTSKPCAAGTVNNIFVYFGGEKSQTEAYEIGTIPEENLLILIVRTEKRYEAVNLSSDPLTYEVVFTVCEMSGRKLNDKASAPEINELEGMLGLYKGTVGTPCYALDASGRYIDGSGKYFQVGFCIHDDIITLKNVNAKHTAEIAIAATIFRLNGEIAGMVFSDGGWSDCKVGLLATHIISCLKTYFGSDEWELELKKDAESWLESN